MAKVNEHAERAARLVQQLQYLKEQSDYPTTASRLREQIDPTWSDEVLLKALHHRSQSAAIVLACKKDPTTAMALVEDTEQFLASAVLLRYALGKLASAEKPLHPVKKIVSRLDSPLRPAFESALQAQLTTGSLPEGVGQQLVRGQPCLYLDQFPPPPPPLPRQSKARQLAEALLNALRQAWTEGKSVVDLNELTCLAAAHWQGDMPPGLVKKALSEEVFTTSAVLAPVSRNQSLIALQLQREDLASSSRLIVELLRHRTTPRKPYLTAAELAAGLPEEIQAGLQARLSRPPLPAGVFSRAEGDTLLFALEDHLSLAVRVGDKMVAALEQCRQTQMGYPAALSELIRTVAPDTTAEQLASLLADRAFRSRLVLSLPDDPGTPVALPGDEKRLACSPMVLERVVRVVSTPEAPIQPAALAASKLDRAIRAEFIPALVERINAGTVPPAVAIHDIRGKIHLRLAEYEPPPPPPPAELVLAERWLQLLREARQSGAAYPVVFAYLLQQTGREPGDRLVKAALTSEPVRTGLIVAVPTAPDSPVVLSGDEQLLLDDPRLLLLLLTHLTTSDNQALAVPDLARKLAAELVEPFLARVEGHLTSNTLPERIGYLRIKNKPYLYLKS